MIETFNKIQKEKLIAIIRENRKDKAYNAAAACIEGGMKIVEITLNTPGAIEIIEKLSINFPQILIGAGTALDINITEGAIKAGARFIVSPHTDERIIKHCNDNNILPCPGTSTPTEMMNASKLGAKIIKVFPIANLGGPAYIKNVRGPLPHLNLIPTGGVDIKNIKDFINAGVFAVGLSRALVPKEAVEEGNFFLIQRLVEEVIKKVKTV